MAENNRLQTHVNRFNEWFTTLNAQSNGSYMQARTYIEQYIVEVLKLPFQKPKSFGKNVFIIDDLDLVIKICGTCCSDIGSFVAKYPLAIVPFQHWVFPRQVDLMFQPIVQVDDGSHINEQAFETYVTQYPDLYDKADIHEANLGYWNGFVVAHDW